MSERDDRPARGPALRDPGAALPPELDPRGPGRPPPGPRPVRRWKRRLAWTALVLSVVLMAVAAVGYVFYRRYDGNITRIAGLTRALPGLSKPAPAPHDARNVLLVGSDTRATTGAQFQGKGAAYTSGQRSDTIILAHLYGGSDQAQLVSFPRDSYVSIPAFTDPGTGKTTAEHKAKINSAIEEGGPALLVATVEKLTDIRVDNYVQIDFAGFQTMVSALGGVEICLTRPAKESNSGVDLPAGRQTVSGFQALAFVRQRYGLPNGDIDRIHRQQAFLASITRKVLSSGTLLDPFKLNAFLSAATKSVTVDDSLSTSGLTSLALRLKGISAGGVSFTTLPFTDLGARRDGQDVVLLDPAKSEAIFAALRQDRAPGQAAPGSPAAPAAPLVVPPRAVRVQVLNAAGTAGLGRTVADDLTARGFTVVGAPGNEGTGAAATVVRYGPTRTDSARTLAAAVPGATLQADPSLGGTVQLVVGSSYTGTVAVSVSPSAPAPAPSTGTPAPAATAAQDGCVA